MDFEQDGSNLTSVRRFTPTTTTTMVNNYNRHETIISSTPSFIPYFIETAQSPITSAVLNLPPNVCSWSPMVPSTWTFTPVTQNSNFYPNENFPTPDLVEWYDYDLSSHSYEFCEPEHGNAFPEMENEFGQIPIASDWDDLQDWAFDLIAEDDEDRDYPSKRLQRMAWNAFRSVRTESVIQDRLQISTEDADVDVWKKFWEKNVAETNGVRAERDDHSTRFQADNKPIGNENGLTADEDTQEGVKITILESLSPIPCSEPCFVPLETTESSIHTAPIPVSYAAASTPRNTAESIEAHLNRTVKMHFMAVNKPLTEPFPSRHRSPKRPLIDQTQPTTSENGFLDQTSTSTPHVSNSLDSIASLSRRNVADFRSVNGGLLLLPPVQDEQRYCIGSSSAGRMVIGLEKLAPPRLYANDFRTICLKKVPHTEDCDKVWCRLNLFRKQIFAEKTAARRNNVAIYELFARQDQFACFGRLPYKWNLDEYLKSDHYTNTVNNTELEGLRILRGIANGLAYVHRGDFRLFHGNLKPSNVLVASDGSVFLTDYGFGRICCPMWSGAAAYRFCRDSDTGAFDPLCWKAYEFFSGYGATPTTAATTPPSLARETPHRQADVFSAALLGYYAITGGRSHPLIDGDEAYRKTLYFYRQRVDRFADFVQLDGASDPIARRLISSMLDMDIKQRPDARYVADHPAFWNEKKRNDFLLAVAEFICAGEKLAPNGAAGTQVQANSLLRILTPKKIASLGFARRLNLTPDNVSKITARFGVKFEDASATIALKTFYRQNRRNSNSGDKSSSSDELEPLWNELAAEIYDLVYPSPPLKLKQFFTK